MKMNDAKNGRPEDEGEEDAGVNLFRGYHMPIFAIAVCRHRIRLLENILINRGISTREEIDKLYRDSFREALPIEFAKLESDAGHGKVKLILHENGEVEIKGQSE
jgi:acid phosphatase family membrane protein YuiD